MFNECFFYGIVDWYGVYFLAPFARGNASEYGCAVFAHVFTRPGTFFAGDALYEYVCVFVNEYCHMRGQRLSVRYRPWGFVSQRGRIRILLFLQIL